MPVKFDPELQRELERYAEKSANTDKSTRSSRFFLYLCILGAALPLSEMLNLDLATKISFMMAVCTLIVFWTLYDAIIILHRTLVISMAGDEWFQKKQLEEHEKA